MKKKMTALLVAVFMLTMVGCGTAAQKAEPKLKKITVFLDWTPNTNHTGVYVASAKGYYSEEGLDVKIVQPTAGGVAQLIAAGKGDFGFSYQEEVTIARTENVPIKAIAAVIQHNTSGFAAPEGKGIKRPRDFEGKKYGGWGSPAEEAMIKALMEADQADFSKVKMVNIGSADFFASVARDVDFAWIFWGWTGIESELRGQKMDFIRLRDFSPALDFYTPVLIAGDKMIDTDPDTVQRFVRATARGYAFAAEQPDAAADILTAAVPELNRDLVIASQRYLAKEYKSDAGTWGEMSEKRWQNYADWMKARNLIKKPLKAEEAFTNRFIAGE